ncbi:MAG: methionine gamma-lyase family protein, partial [Oscillospiraceae bacterium]|nr:methionine gamma-lyase family protein [Oscillospiraceae bacterium]
MTVFDFSPELIRAADKAMELCREPFTELDRLAELNGQKVLKAFIDNRISDIHMKGTNGYGYGDDGRDKLDAVFAQILGAEDALVRHNFVNGTHAITTALFGILRTGDT